MMWWNGAWGWGGVGMLFAGFAMLVFWGVIIALIVWGVSMLAKPHAVQRPTSDTPLDIAKARYARGEISKEEFEQLRKDLTS